VSIIRLEAKNPRWAGGNPELHAAPQSGSGVSPLVWSEKRRDAASTLPATNSIQPAPEQPRETHALAADEQPWFVILNEVKDPSGYCWLAMRCWILRGAQDDRLS